MPLLPKAARAALHFWEEPCISGQKGSGTVFFTGCNLDCAFCQNYEVSHLKKGKPITYIFVMSQKIYTILKSATTFLGLLYHKDSPVPS